MKYAKILNEKTIRDLPTPLTISIANPQSGSIEELISIIEGYGNLIETECPSECPHGFTFEKKYERQAVDVLIPITRHDVLQTWEIVENIQND